MSAWGTVTPGTGTTAYRLTITPAMVRAGAAEQSIQWSTGDVSPSRRCASVVWELGALFDFTIAAPGSTITVEVLNDNGDVLFTLPIDVAHGTGTGGQSRAIVPLVVGPLALNGDTTPLPYLIRVSTDAASLSLVKAATGELWVEVVLVDTQSTTVSTPPV